MTPPPLTPFNTTYISIFCITLFVLKFVCSSVEYYKGVTNIRVKNEVSVYSTKFADALSNSLVRIAADTQVVLQKGATVPCI